MNRGVATAIVLALLAGGYFIWSSKVQEHSSPPTESPPPAKCDFFVTAEHIYCNEALGFFLKYPPSYEIDVNPYATDWVELYFGPEGHVLPSEPNVFGIHAELDANNCHLNLCERASKGYDTYNGVTWDYLGTADYCDGDANGGGCNTSEVYRTKRNGKSFYISGASHTVIKEALKGFHFNDYIGGPTNTHPFRGLYDIELREGETYTFKDNSFSLGLDQLDTTSWIAHLTVTVDDKRIPVYVDFGTTSDHKFSFDTKNGKVTLNACVAGEDTYFKGVGLIFDNHPCPMGQ